MCPFQHNAGVVPGLVPHEGFVGRSSIGQGLLDGDASIGESGVDMGQDCGGGEEVLS